MFAIGLIAGMMSPGRRSGRLVLLHDPIDPDLPCPWCRSQTFEDDSDCPSCGKRFG